MGNFSFFSFFSSAFSMSKRGILCALLSQHIVVDSIDVIITNAHGRVWRERQRQTEIENERKRKKRKLCLFVFQFQFCFFRHNKSQHNIHLESKRPCSYLYPRFLFLNFFFLGGLMSNTCVLQIDQLCVYNNNPIIHIERIEIPGNAYNHLEHSRRLLLLRECVQTRVFVFSIDR